MYCPRINGVIIVVLKSTALYSRSKPITSSDLGKYPSIILEGVNL